MSLNDDNIIFKDHAINQFKLRWYERNAVLLNKPEKTARALFSKAKEEEIEPRHRLNRLLNNKVTEAKYFVRSGWRFVVIEKDNKCVVVTIEHEKAFKKYRSPT